MSQEQKPGQQKYNALSAFTASIATIGGSVGFSTLGIILVALVGGLWLDKTFGTKPLFTVILMLGSIPVSIIVMFMVVRSTTTRLLQSSKPETQHSQVNEEEEENGRGKTP